MNSTRTENFFKKIMYKYQIDTSVFSENQYHLWLMPSPLR